ncbi:hypothetical protein BDV41DRAFT_549100 [Aspergillus transmontanensis]|uniref:Uncharacterized protein n=1 Tax=Aspergillus transmontanensis TaxID=1034304 RepID=A0A5N6VLV5_9EURO|nr:hypothetical protein BDV41DRAFT_549100 [Aspergillus transmontanensis]
MKLQTWLHSSETRHLYQAFLILDMLGVLLIQSLQYNIGVHLGLKKYTIFQNSVLSV